MVSCRCFEDKSLTKGRIEWCDWCRCYDCGGRINKTHTTDEDGGGSWISRYITVPDTNADLALLIGLFGSLVWTVMYVNDYLFRVLHCLGCICAVFCAHRMVTFLGY